MTTKTQAERTSAKALSRFAAVAAVLLTLCLLFMMPVGAEGADDVIDTWAELKTALSTGGDVTLGNDISYTVSTNDDFLSVTEDTKLDLAGNKIEVTYSGTESYGLIEVTGGTFTLTDNVGNGELTLNPQTEPYNPWNVAVALIKVKNNANAIIDASPTTKLSIAEGLVQSGVYALEVYSMSGSPTLSIKEGIISSSYIGVRANLNSATNTATIEMTGGKISGEKRGIWIQQTNAFSNQYNLKISAGEITCSNGFPLYFTLMNAGGDGISTTTEISGGILTGKSGISASSQISGDTTWIGEYVYPGLIMYTYSNGAISAKNHVLKITGTPTICNTNNGDIIGVSYTHQWKGYYSGEEYYENTYDVTEYKFTEDPTVEFDLTVSSQTISSTDFKGIFSVPAIGKSYVWKVNGETRTDLTENEAEITFTPGDSETQTVSVNIVLSDTYSKEVSLTINVPIVSATVTYDKNGGTGSMGEVKVYSDEIPKTITLPECTFTAPEGKVFKAWQIGDTEYAAGVSYEVTADTPVTALWKGVGEAVVPSLDENVVNVDGETDKTEIITSGDNVKPDTVSKKVTITDTTTGVKIEVQYDDDVTFDGNSASGNVEEITVTYPKNQVAVSADADSTEEVITQTVSFQLDTLTTVLPQIESVFKEEEAQKITDKPEFKDHKPFAMITATNAEAVNNNMTSEDSIVTVEFRVPKTLVEKLVNGNLDLLRGYHITVKDGAEVVKEIEISEPVLDGDEYIITLTGNRFSSYVLGYEEPKTTIGGGSATDTGSGNYQYYPRSVPTDGIVDFGTSKVVTGMELPAGSDGTVTLNIKPTFAMPENGFYAFEIDAPGYNLDAKINGGLSFQIPVADLEAAGWAAEDIVLFHGTVGEDGKITWEALPTNLVKNENGVAYYKAAINSCSPFYIGFVKDGSVVNTEVVNPTVPETPEQPVTPDEPEVLPPVDEPETPEQPTESPAPILAVLAGLGAAVVLRRK